MSNWVALPPQTLVAAGFPMLSVTDARGRAVPAARREAQQHAPANGTGAGPPDAPMHVADYRSAEERPSSGPAVERAEEGPSGNGWSDRGGVQGPAGHWPGGEGLQWAGALSNGHVKGESFGESSSEEALNAADLQQGDGSVETGRSRRGARSSTKPTRRRKGGAAQAEPPAEPAAPELVEMAAAA